MSTNEIDQEHEAAIDATLEDTFPASDPPAWTLGSEPHSSASMTTREEKRLNLLGVAGSLRRASYNHALLRAAQQLVPANTVLEIFDIAGIPLFNQDDENTLPMEVVEFKTRIRAADAILIATPEYNCSIPGVLKNAIDWVSRPSGDNAWSGKPVAVVGA
jgi:chromate reductase, NAD(P)H dehydrogenase (quinone)